MNYSFKINTDKYCGRRSGDASKFTNYNNSINTYTQKKKYHNTYLSFNFVVITKNICFFLVQYETKFNFNTILN